MRRKRSKRRLVGDGAHRRDGQGQAQEPQGPVAQRADQEFLRVGAQLVGERGVEQPRERQQGRDEQDGLGGRVQPDRAPPAGCGRGHQ
jgi:hypothetical protein